MGAATGAEGLFITGYAETILSEGLLGTDMAVMTKPFAISDLTARIRTMMGIDPVQKAG
jgi:DNA-binding response OmpR family regulator